MLPGILLKSSYLHSLLPNSIGIKTIYMNSSDHLRVAEFAFKGQYDRCSNNVKCGSILNWLGIEAYPIYHNLPIMDAQKQDPEQLLAAFEKYFKPERNVFQS